MIRLATYQSVLFLLLLNALTAGNAGVEDIGDDTTRIRHLFNRGYDFIEGPSDSLLHYFSEALRIIDNNLDVLKANPDREKEDLFKSLKWRVYIEFGIEHFFKSDYTRALDYFHRSLDLARDLENPDLLSESYSEIGIVLKNQGKLDEALNYYDSSLIYARMGKDTSWIASCLVNMGNAYKEKGYLIISQEYYLEALKTLEPLGHKRRIAACYQNMGEVYSLQKDHVKAREYYMRALKLAREDGDQMREAACLMNIGYLYFMEGMLQKARDYYQEALGYYNASGYSHEMDDCYIMLGDSWLREGEASKSMEYYKKALLISRQEKDFRKLAEVYCKMGEAFYLTGNYSEAMSSCLESLEMARKTSYLEVERRSNEVLSEIYLQKGDPESAIRHYREHSRLKDSIFNADKYKALAELEVKYETEKKEQQIALYGQQAEVQRLKILQRNRMMFAVGAGSILILLIAYLLFQRNQARNIQRSAELEQKLLRSQMNPHFIFNSLIAIQSFIYRKDAVQAGDYLAGFAELTRFTLESSRAELISLEKEVGMMKVYLDLQKLRFEGHFDYNISLDEDLDAGSLMIPPMFAQPFLENAIEHGLRHRETGGLLYLSYSLTDEECLMITVKDNGIGKEKAKLKGKRSGHHSMGISITKERLEILSKKHKREFRYMSNDLQDAQGENTGVEVLVEVPVTKIV
jgi:tetratricopeptide (TPR) repeat protein